jgi:hypothetical protein
MTKLAQRRTCPYCRRVFNLGSCKIIGTNVDRSRDRGHAGPRHGVETEDKPPAMPDSPLPSGTQVTKWFGDYPIIAEAPSDIAPSSKFDRLRRWMGHEELVPLHDVGRTEDLPARACPECKRALPSDIDERDFLTIAVIGTSQAGKTHYLASLIRDAYRRQGLADYGYTEFVPDEITAYRYEREYYAPLFDDHRALGGTNPQLPEQFHPLSFRVTPKGCQSFGLLMYDVSGEILTNRRLRAELAPFVQHAAGAIFLVDPYWLPRMRDMSTARRSQGHNQADLLAACIEQMTPQGRRDVPFAIALSKSDVVSAMMDGHRPVFADDAPTDPTAWAEDRNLVDEEVRRFLVAAEAYDLLAVAGRLDRVSFHAVSPLGRTPDEHDTVSPSPVRCLDPLVTILGDLIPTLQSAGS